MVRASLLSVAVLALSGALAIQAEESKAVQKERDGDHERGYRVYSVSIRCQNRTLLSRHDNLRDAFRAAAALREKSPGRTVEVTTGSEGKKVPTGAAGLYF